MEKYIAFGLYQKNEQGAFQPAGKPSLQQDVYLASDVQAALSKYGQHLRNCEAGSMGVFDDCRSPRQCSCGFDSLMGS